MAKPKRGRADKVQMIRELGFVKPEDAASHEASKRQRLHHLWVPACIWILSEVARPWPRRPARASLKSYSSA
jgi:hypothetical protein